MWPLPAYQHPELVAIELGVNTLGGMVNSYLNQKLVQEKKLASRAVATLDSYQGISFLYVKAEAEPNVDLDELAKHTEQAVQDFLKQGVSKHELQQSLTYDAFWNIGGLEWMGGYVGRASMLANGALHYQQPDFYKKRLQQEASLTVEQVNQAMRTWLTKPKLYVKVIDGDKNVANSNTSSEQMKPVDEQQSSQMPAKPNRTMPKAGKTADIHFPKVQSAMLSNGIKVHLVSRPEVPTLRLVAMVKAGFSADAKQQQGLQELVSSSLKEGTQSYSAEQLKQLQLDQGVVLTSSISLDHSMLSVQGLTLNLERTIAAFADVLRRPTFPSTAVESIKNTQLQRIEQQKLYPDAIAGILMPKALYGEQHPYGYSQYGLGTKQTVEPLTRDDVVAFHQQWYTPQNTEIFAVGAVDLPQLTQLLEQNLADWHNPNSHTRKKTMDLLPVATRSQVILVHQPQATQSNIYAGQLLATKGTQHRLELDLAMDLLGGVPSRLNTALREQQNLVYSVSAELLPRQGQLAYQMKAPVRIEQTMTAIQLMQQEFKRFVEQGITQQELDTLIASRLKSLSGQLDASASVIGEMQQNASYQQPMNNLETLAQQYKQQTVRHLNQMIRQHLKPNHLTWVIVSDCKKMLKPLQQQGFTVQVVSQQTLEHLQNAEQVCQ